MTATILTPITPAETANNLAGTVAATITTGRKCAARGDLSGARWYLGRARKQLAQLDEGRVSDASSLQRIVVGMRLLANAIVIGDDI